MLIEIIVSFFCIAATLAIGKYVLQKIKLEKCSWHEELVFSTGLGLIALATYAFIVNLAGYGYREALALPIVIGTILFFLNKNHYLEITKEVKQKLFKNSIEVKLAALLFAALFLISFIISLAPPSLTQPGPADYDSLNYHLVIPKTYIAQHSLERIPFFAYDNWPHSIETFYTIPMSLGDVSAVKLMMLFVSLIMLLTVFSFARRFVKTQFAILAPLILFSSPVIFLFLGSAYIDIALTLFITLSLMALHSWTEKKNWQNASLISAFAGFAASIKLLGIVPLALITMAVVWLILNQVKKKTLTKSFLAFGFFAALFALPWLLRNFLSTGNPIFPLFSEPLKWIGINASGTEQFMTNWTSGAAVSGVGNSFLNFFALPWGLTMYGKAFNGIISPLFSILAPLFIIAFWKRKTTKFEELLALGCVAFTVIWFVTYQEARFYEPVLAISSVILAIAVSRFPSLQFIPQRIALGVMALALGLSLLYSVSAFPVALGLESQALYLNRTLDTYAPCIFINKQQTVQRVLFYKVEPGFYCNKSFAYTFSYPVDRITTKNKLAIQLQHDEFTHILTKTTVPKTRAVSELLKAANLIYDVNGIQIYKIKD